jgi:predicted nucleotidyltransferase
MVTQRARSTSSWHNLRCGPWPKPATDRLVSALDTLVQRLRGQAAVAAMILFGSYARGEQGRTSDVDLLVLIDADERPERTEVGRAVLGMIGEVEAEARLPMHLSPLLAAAGRPADLPSDLLHAIWADGIVLYARLGVLEKLQPTGLAAWSLIRYSVARARPSERVRLSRRLHGGGGRVGLVRPPSLALAPGVVLVRAEQQQAVRDALDEAGATYDALPVWREA